MPRRGKQTPPFGPWKVLVVWGGSFSVGLPAHLLQKACPSEPISCFLLGGQLGPFLLAGESLLGRKAPPLQALCWYEWGSEYKSVCNSGEYLRLGCRMMVKVRSPELGGWFPNAR